jgi:hypothetical protein
VLRRVRVNAYSRQGAYAFYQAEPFWALDAVTLLSPKFEMSVALAMFFVTTIRLEKYGRKWRQ